MATASSPTCPPPALPRTLLLRRRLSLFRILVRAFIGVCFLIGALALLIWLIYRPRTIQVAVATATLSGFDLSTAASTTPALSYNLTAALAVTNPNRRVSIYYDDQLRAEGLYQGVRFGRAALPLSFQGTRRTDTAPALLVGISLVGLNLNADAFGEDNRTEVFPVDLWVEGVVRYKFGELTTTTATTLTVKCHLALKLLVASGWVECIVIDF
ncbi:NDR1/HIN1-like protein 10 [Panicum virgatum]|uniref:Late embryogenesis abundant protein LEA-2 subgroup domain-containing protein n=1 Tax=Panicum virgatum TaxID=38727 RepID=A0A8T0SRH8_PANVG|nr:NDR1/HIN1-like protein 10 [Panicum virgatum]KAG2602142.1 hypothetical protein PVAP13_5KG648300 [Panicum virgatum]